MEKNVEIPNIEAELQKLWHTQSLGNQLKASLFNLVIYTHESRRAEYLKEVIKNFVLKFPCRIIFIDYKKEASSEFLKVTVTDKLIGPDNKSLFCDQINIEVTTSFLHRVSYILLPHFIPDLPIYLMWGQDPIYEHEILPSLEQYAERLIYDSECNHNLRLFSSKILEKMHRSKLQFMDVSWGLIAGWRDTIAECYNDSEQLQHLHDSQTIDIVYNVVPTDKIFHAERQAIYLQTWIASQMGWIFIDNAKVENQMIFRYSNGENTVKVTLTSDHNAELSSGQLISVEINSAAQHTSLKLQKNNPSRIVVNVSTNEECDLPFIITVADPRRGTAVLKELFFQRPSIHYKEVLTYLSQIDLIL